MSRFTPLRNWTEALIGALQREPVIVRVVLASVRGSAPRESGVAMLVGRTEFAGTIGGGRLEWEALIAARGMIDDAAVPARLERFVLAADLGQCCGGVVELWLERYTRANLSFVQALRDAAREVGDGGAVLMSTTAGRQIERRIIREVGAVARADALLRTPRAQAVSRLECAANGAITLLERLDQALPPLWLYGAGHVGQALARIFIELPVALTWIDERADLFPAALPEVVCIAAGVDPVGSVAAAPPGTRFLVLTHGHALDYALCRAILARADFAWAGLIGSSSKAARFRSRLMRENLSPASIARLVCPIGIAGISSKWPAAIAVGVAAQVLRDISTSALNADSAEHARVGAFAVVPVAAAPVAIAPTAAGSCEHRNCADCGS